MDFKPITETTAKDAGALAYEHHRSLRGRYPWLPEKNAEAFVPRIRWMVQNGKVHSLWEGKALSAFLGWFPIDDLRNEGLGAYSPDWCVGAADGSNAGFMLRILIRDVLGELKRKGIGLHAASVLANAEDFRLAFDLSGYGRIVMDAGRPTHELLKAMEAGGPSDAALRIRRADASDAAALAALERELARHIAEPPVLMPRTRSMTAAEWTERLGEKNAAVFLALRNGAAVGFIKAQEPAFDVTFTVHDPSTLAINGMFVNPAERGRGAGAALLRAMAVHAAGSGKELVSVDCETTNPEAYGFWTRFFAPLSWSMERRFTTGSS
jgi:ribosomal protein S18 acetylase RimI-like enzyme